MRERGEIIRFDGNCSLTLRLGDWTFVHRTPFSNLAETPEAKRHRLIAAALGMAKPVLPYALDIWLGGKVMNLEWDHAGSAQLISFRKGEWDAELAAALSSVEVAA